MPLFHFHLRTPDGLEEDKIGLSLSGLEDAHREVLQAIPDLMAEMLRNGRNPLHCVFEITDEQGQILMEVAFSASIADDVCRQASCTDV
jgi:hypothetical protein